MQPQASSGVRKQTFPQQLMDAMETKTIAGAAFDSSGRCVLKRCKDGCAFMIRDGLLLGRELLPRCFSGASL